MSQYHPQYNYDTPSSLRPHRPPPSIDENGFNFDPRHSGSSFYDDPEEFETMRELDREGQGSSMMELEEGGADLFAATPLSSATPSSSGDPSSSYAPQPALTSSSGNSRRPQPPPFFSGPPPPAPNFSFSQFGGTISNPSSSSSARSAAPFHNSRHTALSSSVVTRPNPIRPMPIKPVAQRNFSQPRAYSSSGFSSYPASTNAHRGHGFSVSMIGPKWNSASNETGLEDRGRFEEVEEEDQDEAQYWGDSGYDAAVMSVDTDQQQAQTRRPVPPLQTSQDSRVQYYDDLIPQDQGPSFTRNAVSSNRIQRGGIKLVAVSRLPDAFRSIWRFGVFNAVQSVCFDIVYGTDENVVVSAPTGAGKTVLFELAIIRLLMSSESTQSKVLYMAPTKSLCAERANDWKKKFDSGLGWKVVELTGDSDIGSTVWREISSSRIIVTTPEKWDAMTRRWHDHDRILSELQLFCVDEVHSVGTDVRGAVLEVVVSRMKTLGTSTRFVAVSATVPNIKDVADWLSNVSDQQPAKVFEFGDEFRPCPLQKIVYGYNKNNNDFAFAKTLNLELYNLIKKHAFGNPVLIFCSTRKGCLEAAEQLVKDYKESLASSSAKSNRPNLAWPKPPRTSYSINDKRLASLIETGVSTHHAGMDVNDRKLVEKLFLDGKISVICSTSTLAVGVNLPARMVIIRGTKGYFDGRTVDYADMDILQMLGRAGRPQFDKIGVALIMTERDQQQRYENLVNAQKKLESCLHKNLTEHINSEITLRTITNVDSALRWLRSTFLYVRISKNAPYYAIAKNSKLSPDARLEEICVEAVKQLVSEGIVVEDEDQSLAPNEYSDIMSRFYISHPTFVALKSMPHGANMRSLLETISKAEEFSSFRLRQGEKSVLAKVNKMIRFPVEKVATTADRIMILLQVVLEGIAGADIKTENVNPLLEISAIWPSAVRIAKAIFDLAVLRKDGAARVAFELLRSLNGRCWDGSSFVLRQLKGIGEKGYKALVDSGIRSFADVANAAPDRLELILHRKPPYGSSLIDAAKSFPKFQISLSIENEEVRDVGVEVELRVEVNLQQTKPPAITKKGVMNLYASLLILTSDNHFIEYRRCPLSQIAKGSIKPFSVLVILVKPSQRVVASVSCDLIAGSELRAEVKPATKASDFPVPHLSSDPDESLDEFRAQPTPASSKPVSKPFKAPTQKRPAAEVEGPAEIPQPRMRPDGKYDCNHSCGDKTKCKHFWRVFTLSSLAESPVAHINIWLISCRDGLDKPPPPSKKRKLAASNSRTNSTEPTSSSATSKKQKTQSRIPMKVSSGVTLTQDSSGKIVTRKKSSDSAAEPKQTSTNDDEDDIQDDDDDDFEFPTPEQVASGHYERDKKKLPRRKAPRKKKLVFSQPSPPPPAPSRSRTVSPDPFASSPEQDSASTLPSSTTNTSSAFSKKKEPLSRPSFDKSTLALDKKSKVSFKEFDSSDDELEIDVEVPKKKQESFVVKEQKIETDEPLFRKDPFEPDNSDHDDDDFFDKLYPPIENDEVGGGGGGKDIFAGAAEIEDEFDQLDADTARAIEKSFEDLLEAEAENRREGRAGEGGGYSGIENGKGDKVGKDEVEVSQEKEETVGDDEDDDFDDWLNANVVIKD
ncbi:DNA helicase [Sporobolomyces salmoneus]|uniref:DNA helicase n=1 Tax=Sporobolomyces salmoneus TaxID=183962 RepID=UPI0031749376